MTKSAYAILKAENEQLWAELDARGVRWQEQFDRAETAERRLALLVESVRVMADRMDGSGHYPATGWAYELRVTLDQASG